MKKLFVSTVIATLVSVPLIVKTVDAADTSAISTINTDIASYPIYAALGSQPPLIMLLMGRDHSMYYEAYNDMTDLDDDGKIDGLFTPHVVYDGIFESNWCYDYDETNSLFVMDKPATQTKYQVGTVYSCDKLWSGNFLNYLTSSRMDIVKRILIGGQRYFNMGYCTNKGNQSVDSDNVFNTCRDSKGYPLLTRQFIPHDTHGWAKSFSKIDMDNRCKEFGYSCPLRNFGKFYNSESAMFGNVGRELLVVTDTMISGSNLDPYQNFGSYDKLNSNDPSYTDDKAIYVWNWVARESAAVGKSGSVKGPLSFGGSSMDGNTPMNKPGVNGNSGHYTIYGVHRHNLVVQACNFGSNDMPSRCKNYGTDAKPVYNTVGLLQDFSKESAVQAYFGLITATWEVVTEADAKRKAALRAPISDLSKSNQINLQNGDFAKGSVYALIDVLSLHKDGTPNSTSGGNTSNTWSDCSINSDNNVTTSERGCSDWGNPLVPMIQRSYDYFAGNSVSENGSDKIKIRHFTDTTSDILYDYPRLSSAQNPTPYKTFDYCYPPINFILTDENISMDYNTSVANVVDSNLDDGFKIIKKGEGEGTFGDCDSCNHIFGEFSGTKKMRDSETVHSIKTASNLMEVRGVSTLEPNLQGSLKGAALAAYIHNNPLRFTFNTSEGSKEKSVPGFEHYAVSMASYLPQFEIYTSTGKKALIVPTCKAPKRDVQSQNVKWGGNWLNLTYSYDKEESYTSNCSIADVFYVNSQYVTIDGENKLSGIEFRVTYEDNEAGSDFDMDALFTYKVWSEPDKNDDIINVSITGFYHDTYAGQIGGYSIFGTDGVITPDYSKCKSDACSIKDYVLDKRTLYLDMMKVDQHSSTFTLMRSFSDPYNEYNNISGNVEDRSSPVSVTQNGPTDYSDHRFKCLNNDNVNNIKGKIFTRDNHENVVKFLPSFSSSCKATVARKFKVVGMDSENGFYDSPLDYASYYGSKYGESGTGSMADRKKNNPNYFHVTNASKLASQITAALTQAVGSSGNSGTGLTFPTVDVSSDHSAITATYDTSYWTGSLHRNKLTYNADGSVNVTTSIGGTWVNGEVKFDNSSKILILDKTGTSAQLTADLLKNDTKGKYPLSQSLLSEFNLGDCSIDDKSKFYDQYVSYLYGSGEWEADVDEHFNADKAEEMLSCSGNPFYGFHARSATHTNKRTLGAIINSTPQYYTVNGSKKIIFAANDGMVHVVNEADGHVDYSIIPYVAQDLMPRYAKPGNSDHYINDGIITIVNYKTVASDGNSTPKTIAIGTLGSTHPGMYAFDLSQTQPEVLWELSPYYYRNEVEHRVRNLGNLGAIQSQITVLPYKVDGSKGLYAIFGNGYNSEDGVAGIAVVNALTGKVVSGNAGTGGLVVNNSVAKWSDPICNRNDAYSDFKGKSSDPNVVVCYKNGMNQIAAIDENHDSIPDYIYTSDLYGNVYRVTTMNDSANISVSNWKLVHLHTTVTPMDTNGKVKIQPITTVPSLSRDAKNRPMVIVGTGRYLGASDLDTGDIQSVWALSDVDFKQQNVPNDAAEILCAESAAATDMSCYRKTGNNGLYSRDLEVDNTKSLADGFRDFKAMPADIDSKDALYDADRHKGWVVNFTTLGSDKISERVKNNMRVLDKHLYVTTMIPGASECEGGGTSHWYDLNINSALFYTSAAKSQSYEKSIYSEMTMGYDKSNGVNADESSSQDPNERRDRTNATYGCSTVLIGLSTNDNNPSVKVGPEFCPRVESWQFIYN